MAKIRRGGRNPLIGVIGLQVPEIEPLSSKHYFNIRTALGS